LGALFDSAFLGRLENLRYAARQVPRGGRPAEQRSAGQGGGVEFAEYRAYAPGEDLRRVDWNGYSRRGRLFLRLCVEEMDLPVHVVLDCSASVFLHGRRAAAAKQAAAALAWVGLGSHDRVRVHPFGGNPLPSFGPVSAKGGGFRLLAWLEGLEASGASGALQALRRLRGLAGRRGLLALVSDFFFPEGLGPVLAELARQRHRLLLVRLVHPEDGEPVQRGEVRVVDCESAEFRDVTVTPEVLGRYRAAFRAFEEELAGFVRSRAAGPLRLDVTGDVVAQFERLFTGGRLPV